MDKWRLLLAQMAAIGLVLLLASGLFLGMTTLGVLNELVLKLYQEAIPIAEKLLAIKKLALCPEYPDTAESLNNLARLYRDMGDYSRPEPLYRQALQVLQKALGSDSGARSMLMLPK